MKFLNDFKNLFAIVGVVSIIFFTCASESTSTNVNLPQLTGGTYQVSMADAYNITTLNTETGTVRTYYRNTSTDGNWEEGYYFSDGNNTFPASGELTLTH